MVRMYTKLAGHTPTLSLRFAEQSVDGREVSILFRVGNSPEQKVWFRSDGPELRHCGSALFCLGLIPALELGAPLRLGTPPDKTLFERTSEITDLLCRWYPGLKPVAVTLDQMPSVEPESRPVADEVGLFYSAGVDSSYSLLTAQDRIDWLITLIGADVPVGNAMRAEKLRETARVVARKHGKRCVIIETNIRRVMDRWIGWVEYHGAVLAAVGHLLSNQVGRVLIASSADEASWQRPWGSHPGLDPLWGNANLAIEHHALVPRFSKIAAIVGRTELMASLRVCDYDDANCGRCSDCIFMLNALAVLDAFGLAPTYRKGDLGCAPVIVDGRGTRTDLLDMRATTLRTGHPPGLANEIDRAIAAFDQRQRRARWVPTAAILRRVKRLKRRVRYRL